MAQQVILRRKGCGSHRDYMRDSGGSEVDCNSSDMWIIYENEM